MAVGLSLFLLIVIGCVVLVGLFLVYRGVRGIPTLCDPKCAKCGYDLRWVDPNVNVRCPECGSDLKAARAVRFADHQRRPRLILLGSVVVLVALLAPVLLVLSLKTRARAARPVFANAASSPTSTLIANLATTADQPWDWQELERRWAAGQLSRKDASAAIERLINHLKTRPGGSSAPLHWSGNFVTLMDQFGVISDEQFGRLALAFYGSQPGVTTRSRVRQGQPLAFDVGYGSPWNLPGVKFVRALRRVTLDGTEELRIGARYGGHQPVPLDELSGAGSPSIDGQVVLDAAPGKHELRFEFDMGLVPAASSFRTGTDKPGQSTRWPKPRYKWSRVVTLPVDVLASDAQAVDLITDDALDPVKGNRLVVTAIAYPRSEKYSALKLTFEAKRLETPIVSTAAIRTNGRVVRLDRCVIDGGSGTRDIRWDIPRPAPSVRTIDVVLTPFAEEAERRTLFDRIWGKEVVLKDVPLQREDLEDAADSPASRPSSGPAASRPVH